MWKLHWASLLLLTVQCSPLQALLAPSTGNGTCQQSTNSSGNGICSLIDTNRLRQTIASGRVYQQENFLSEEEVQTLLSDIERLVEDGKMVPSGLSNTNKGKDQNFGKNDRMVCPIPWWVDSLEGRRIALGSESAVKENILNDVSQRIQELRLQVSAALDRPTMTDANHAHECYYSKSSEGASLARHLDEFHEETKGPRGWLLPSRRSISWLIYLSDKDWDPNINGGELRSFPQKQIQGVSSSNDGNLQIGWLDDTTSAYASASRPVYLDSWYKPPGKENGEVIVEPHCILYTIKDNNEKEYISKPWINSMESSLTDFIKTQTKFDMNVSNLFVSQKFARGFKLIEDRETWVNGSPPPGSAEEDIAPIRGSIVMFDSVSLPHEVRVVKQGTRAAAAGWFHEQTQSIPEGFY